MRPLRFSRQWIAVGWLLVAGLVAVSLTTIPVEARGLSLNDKVAHVVAYLVVMAWFGQVWSSRRALLVHACFLVLLGIALELAQGSAGHRTPDPGDALANAVGVGLGWLTTLTPMSSLLERFEARLGPR